jgi:hypothetical protein
LTDTQGNQYSDIEVQSLSRLSKKYVYIKFGAPLNKVGFLNLHNGNFLETQRFFGTNIPAPILSVNGVPEFFLINYFVTIYGDKAIGVDKDQLSFQEIDLTTGQVTRTFMYNSDNVTSFLARFQGVNADYFKFNSMDNYTFSSAYTQNPNSRSFKLYKTMFSGKSTLPVPFDGEIVYGTAGVASASTNGNYNGPALIGDVNSFQEATFSFNPLANDPLNASIRVYNNENGMHVLHKAQDDQIHLSELKYILAPVAYEYKEPVMSWEFKSGGQIIPCTKPLYADNDRHFMTTKNNSSYERHAFNFKNGGYDLLDFSDLVGANEFMSILADEENCTQNQNTMITWFEEPKNQSEQGIWVLSLKGQTNPALVRNSSFGEKILNVSFLSNTKFLVISIEDNLGTKVTKISSCRLDDPNNCDLVHSFSATLIAAGDPNYIRFLKKLTMQASLVDSDI